jgi:hypothetical protein
MIEIPRPLTDGEADLLRALVELAPFDKRDELRAHLGRAEAGRSCKCHCGSFRILIDGKGKTEQDYLVAEGFIDRGERPSLGVLLFASGGRPTYLEVFDPERREGDPPLQLPAAADVKA